ncbi:hypothetical protein EJ05DRAFT_478564 [Pseudovirgaria hyperparasitica]|uniref:Uncharacterized protein n=1 Tax=Pseudovirgaria hyperparasitica TaxID=470096 RepID=A0A6A6W0Z0_9PEZI|nr:uncharacterized protein EJ05DRAFT_478564 [Pseudovirgaria hyperparasitica]KAF2755590.1 hypothetical protein EJ05DRAFT_478564 [Pseudovirgaria hyperparasitica]
MPTKLPHFNWDSHKLKKRRYLILPWIQDPTSGAIQETKNGRATLVFAQRHEANTTELFFDLFFVANLALFTQYHSITDHKGFLTYIEFFGLIWGTWFSITLFDVRFGLDSVFERACKFVQYAVFVVFALVGSEFEPGSRSYLPKDNVNFRILSWALCASRALLMIQYLVVLYFVMKRRYRRLYFPLALNAFWYLVTATVFGAMSAAFPNTGNHHPHIYLMWYAAIFLEIVCVLSVSTIWRTLSFKLTHLAERMSLLTLIIMGEGIIGITKTVSIILAKGPVFSYFGLVLCILFIIFWLYFIYFDNTPRGHFGTIRQQVWAFLHFPFHLSVVGIVEGAQQIVRARYVIDGDKKFNKSAMQYCVKENLDGIKLQNKLAELIRYYDFPSKAQSNQFLPDIYESLYAVGNHTDICSPENSEGYVNANGEMIAYPDELWYLWEKTISAVYAGTVTDKQVPDFDDALTSSISAWETAYSYFWGALGLLAFTTILMFFMCRRSKRDIYTYFGIGVRVFVLVMAAFLGGYAAANDDFFTSFMYSSAVVPTAMACLFLIVFVDSIGRGLSNYALRNTHKDIIDDEAEAMEHDHLHGHHHDHDGSDDEIELKPQAHTPGLQQQHEHWYGGVASPPLPGPAPLGYSAVQNPGTPGTPAFHQEHTAYGGAYSHERTQSDTIDPAYGHARHPSDAYDNPDFRRTSGFGGGPAMA